LKSPHTPVEHPHSPAAYHAETGSPSPAPPVAHADRGLGPRARLGSRGHAAGGCRAHIWGDSLPRRSGPRHSTFLAGAGEFLPKPTATKHHHESSHDHRPPGQPLVPRRPSIEPLPRRSLAHSGYRRRPPVRHTPAVPPNKFRHALAPRYTRGPPRPLPWPSPPPDSSNSGECRCLNLSTSMGGTRSKVEGEDRHDLEPEGLREDTRHKIYTGSGSRSSYPTSCLG
jgi:hypothetical protein